MPFGLNITAQPAIEPITLNEAKAFCSVDNDFRLDDALISGLISAARMEAERYTRRAFFNQGWRLSLDYFPMFWFSSTLKNIRETYYPYSYFFDATTILLPKPRLVSVDSITYIDATYTKQTLDPSCYVYDCDSEPARVSPPFNAYWPTTSCYTPGSIKVNFTTGTYGDGILVNTIPANVKTAVALLTSHFYVNREGQQPIPDAFYRLLDSERFETFALNLY